MKLSNKVALVTGGLKGIGRATVMELATQGADIALNYRASEKNKVLAEELVKELKDLGRDVLCVEGDISHEEDVENIFKNIKMSKVLLDTLEDVFYILFMRNITFKSIKKYFGHLDILVNNAGITRDQLILRMKTEDFDAVINTNLKGTYLCMKQASRLMMKQKSGHIISLSSVVGVIGNAGQVNYAASKAGVIGMTMSLARELGPRGVTVNAVAPGFIETDMTEVLSDEIKVGLKASIPLGTLGHVEDVAKTIAFLASDDAKYITGQTIHVDGGMAM